MTKHGCHNREHFRASLEVQNGWKENGTRQMVTVPVRFNPDCQYDNRQVDAGCAGCRWAKPGGAHGF